MDSRSKILEIARNEFASSGLEGARVDRIAEQAGVNKAMIYYHFHSKEELYQAVIDDHFDRIGSFVQQAASEEADLERLILKLSSFYFSLVAERPTFYPILLRELAQGGERIRDAMVRILGRKGLTFRLKSIIEEGIARGEFRNLNSKQTIISFVGMNLFYILAAPILNAVWEIEDEKNFREVRPNEVAQLFLYGLKAR
jgi:AcrR family transcriptional regulator